MHRFKRRPLAAAVVLLFSTPHFANAQSKPVEQTLPEVKVQGGTESGFKTDSTNSATRTDTPLRDIPQIINTVPQELIRSQGATTLQDALRNVPGISYAAAEGGTQANQVFYLRGFPAGGDLFLDGIRDIGEYNRDLFNIESVEVLKGPSGLTFGRGTTAGVINQTSKVADLFSRKEVGLTVGSFNMKRVTGDLNVKTGDTSAFRIVAMVEDANNYRYPQDTNKIGFAPSVRFGIGTRTDVTFSYSYLKTHDTTDYGQPTLFTAATGYRGVAPVSPRTYYGYSNYDFANHETHIGTFRIDHKISDSLSVRNTMRLASYQRQMEATISTLSTTAIGGGTVTAATPLSLLQVTRNHDTGRTRDNDDKVFVNQTELTWKLATGGVKHTVLGGLEIGSERLDRMNYQLDANPALAGVQVPTTTTPLLNPDPYTALSYTKSPNLRALAKGDTIAVYAQDQLELNRYWKAIAGLRVERYAARAEQIPLAAGVAGSGPFARTDTLTSGRGGLIWQPSDRQSYYVSYGNSYNPSGELGVYGGTGTNLSAINQNLDPEKNVNYEVGAHWDFTPALRLRSAVFRNEKTNARMADPVSGLTVLAGKRRVDGIEFELTGSITPKWDVYSGIAFLDGTIVTGAAGTQGNTPLGVADSSGNLWTVYRLGGGWEIGGGARYSSGPFLTDANNAKLDKYTVVDAMVAYVTKKYELRLNMYNLSDKQYYTGGYNNSPNRVLPGQPRSAFLTARYNFD